MTGTQDKHTEIKKTKQKKNIVVHFLLFIFFSFCDLSLKNEFPVVIEIITHIEMVASISFYNAVQLYIPKVKKDPIDLPSLCLFTLHRGVSSLQKQLATATELQSGVNG